MKIFTLALSILIHLSFISPVAGSDPQYDGVYAQLTNGDLVRLNRVPYLEFRNSRLSTGLIFVSGRGDDRSLLGKDFFQVALPGPFRPEFIDPIPEYMNCYVMFGFKSSTLTLRRVINLQDIEALVVRSPRQYKLNSIRALVPLGTIKSAVQERQGHESLPNPVDVDPRLALHPIKGRLQNCHGRPGELLHTIGGQLDLVMTWGWRNWRTQTINNLVTRFVPEGGSITPRKMGPDQLKQSEWPRRGFVVEVEVDGSLQFYYLAAR